MRYSRELGPNEVLFYTAPLQWPEGQLPYNASPRTRARATSLQAEPPLKGRGGPPSPDRRWLAPKEGT
jgi:hypothetical protein